VLNLQLLIIAPAPIYRWLNLNLIVRPQASVLFPATEVTSWPPVHADFICISVLQNLLVMRVMYRIMHHHLRYSTVFSGLRGRLSDLF
jgi:hypothetical protein